MPSRAGCDCTENFNSDLKYHCKCPTPVQLFSFTKAINLSHFFGGVTNSNYQLDDTTKEYLTDLKIVKELQKAEEEFFADEATEVIEHFTNVGFDPDFENCTDQEYAEANALSYYLGCILDRVINHKNLKKPPCSSCTDFYFDPEVENKQVVNNFIIMKQWDANQTPLKRPSILANKIFHECEALFRSNRDQYVSITKENMSKKLIGFIQTELLSKYNEVIPTCPTHNKHFEIILSRFLRGRLHFWGNYLDKQKREVNDVVREEMSHSSRTARQLQVVI